MAVEGQNSRKKVIENNPQTEVVDVLVVILHLYHLGRDVSWGARVLLLLLHILESVLIDCEAEVYDLDPVDLGLVLGELNLPLIDFLP